MLSFAVCGLLAGGVVLVGNHPLRVKVRRSILLAVGMELGEIVAAPDAQVGRANSSSPYSARERRNHMYDHIVQYDPHIRPSTADSHPSYNNSSSAVSAPYSLSKSLVSASRRSAVLVMPHQLTSVDQPKSFSDSPTDPAFAVERSKVGKEGCDSALLVVAEAPREKVGPRRELPFVSGQPCAVFAWSLVEGTSRGL